MFWFLFAGRATLDQCSVIPTASIRPESTVNADVRTLREPVAMKRIGIAGLLAAVLMASAGLATAAAWPGSPDLATAAKKPAGKNGIRITSAGSDFGTILVNRDNQAIYRFDRENDGRSECYGACAAAWPPVLTKGVPKARGKIRQKYLGTTRRKGGALQVTYAGSPLYYYVGEGPGEVFCNDVYEFGGTWLVVHPSGRAG